MRNKRASIIIFILISALLLSGCMLPREDELLPPNLLQPEEVIFQTIEVERGTIQDILEDFVTTASSIHYDMTFHNRSGFLVELNVRPGQDVQEGDVLARLDTASLYIDIQLQQIEVERQQLLHEDVIRFGGTRLARRLSELDLERAELRLQQLEDEMEKSTIIAPVDGEVVFLNNIGIGEFVPGRTVLMTIADPEFIQFEYTGTQTGRIRQGMEAEIQIGTQRIPARVSMTPTNAPEEERDRMRNTIIFTADDPNDLPHDIRIGTRFNFSIFMDEREDVIVVPISAVTNFMGQSFVQILENGMRTERDLEIGITSRTHVEVITGLTEGELLIIGIER
ncbi:MAG: efflux RND transporter periplasmic adaptor subunit [Oscillospiraceae bacterium]|nr:efflux RND transporter periplasmic adaptor subunit [Oscillospiraceae bacterium]